MGTIRRWEEVAGSPSTGPVDELRSSRSGQAGSGQLEVRGRRTDDRSQKSEVRDQRTSERLSCGSGFQPRSCGFKDLNDFYDFNDCNDFYGFYGFYDFNDFYDFYDFYDFNDF